VKTWVYGIVDEGDFNEDGIPDYSWYGGDDTGEEEYLFLSSATGYLRVDIFKTARQAWKRKFKTEAPDFSEVGGKYQLSSVVLERTQSRIELLIAADYDPQDYKKRKSHFDLRIEQADFIP